MKKKHLSPSFIVVLLMAFVVLIACEEPIDPKVIVNVKNVDGESVSGAKVIFYPTSTYLNPDSDIDITDTNQTVTEEDVALETIQADSTTLIDTLITDATGTVEKTQEYAMILNLLVIKDTLVGRSIANFVEEEVNEVFITIN